MKSITIERRETLLGVTALARELGVTAGHLSRVIRGERRSPRIERALRDRTAQKRRVAKHA